MNKRQKLIQLWDELELTKTQLERADLDLEPFSIRTMDALHLLNAALVNATNALDAEVSNIEQDE